MCWEAEVLQLFSSFEGFTYRYNPLTLEIVSQVKLGRPNNRTSIYMNASILDEARNS